MGAVTFWSPVVTVKLLDNQQTLQEVINSTQASRKEQACEETVVRGRTGYGNFHFHSVTLTGPECSFPIQSLENKQLYNSGSLFSDPVTFGKYKRAINYLYIMLLSHSCVWGANSKSARLASGSLGSSCSQPAQLEKASNESAAEAFPAYTVRPVSNLIHPWSSQDIVLHIMLHSCNISRSGRTDRKSFFCCVTVVHLWWCVNK